MAINFNIGQLPKAFGIAIGGIFFSYILIKYIVSEMINILQGVFFSLSDLTIGIIWTFVVIICLMATFGIPLFILTEEQEENNQ